MRNQSQNQGRKERKKIINMYIFVKVRNKDSGFWQHEARSAWGSEARRQTVLPICQGDNLVGGRMIIY